jgi:hypothetical protein
VQNEDQEVVLASMSSNQAIVANSECRFDWIQDVEVVDDSECSSEGLQGCVVVKMKRARYAQIACCADEESLNILRVQCAAQCYAERMSTCFCRLIWRVP